MFQAQHCAITGIYTAPSKRVAVTPEYPKLPRLIDLKSVKTSSVYLPASFAQLMAIVITELRAIDTDTLPPTGVMVVPKDKEACPIFSLSNLSY